MRNVYILITTAILLTIAQCWFTMGNTGEYSSYRHSESPIYAHVHISTYVQHKGNKV